MPLIKNTAELSEDTMRQLEGARNIHPITPSAPPHAAPEQTAASETEPQKSSKPKGNADAVLVRLSRGKRNEFKSFFSEHGLDMTSGFEMCVEFAMELVRDGKIRISKAGIRQQREVAG